MNSMSLFGKSAAGLAGLLLLRLGIGVMEMENGCFAGLG